MIVIIAILLLILVLSIHADAGMLASLIECALIAAFFIAVASLIAMIVG